MNKMFNKLPSIGFRIISFIPIFNFIPILYIGIKSQNIIDIVCSIAYLVIAFSETPIAPLTWIVGAVHYAISYRRENKKTLNDMRVDVQPQNQKSTIHRTTSSSMFTDISVGETEEKKQTIPQRQSISQKNINFTVSYNHPHNKFFHDMKKFANKDGKSVIFAPFMTYWPTYDSMDKSQQAWYFYWRSQVRQGNYVETGLSYIFVYIYELLSGIGWQQPQEGYQKLLQLWKEYRTAFPTLDRYMVDWIFDFSSINQLPYDDSLLAVIPKLKASPLTDTFISAQAENSPLKLHFSLIDAMSDYSLASSKFYKEGNAELMQEAIPRVIALADATLRKSTGKGILETYGPSRARKQDRYLFASAVCPMANQKTSITIKPFSSDPKLRNYINEIVRYGENVLRSLRGYRGRLRGVVIDDETAKLIEKFLTKEYSIASVATPKVENATTAINLDFSNINELRKQSDAVRSALAVEETVPQATKELLTDLKEVTAIYLNVSNEARNLLQSLSTNSWTCATSTQNYNLVQEINKAAERFISCALLLEENQNIIVEDDFCDELEHILKNPPRLSETENSYNLFDMSKLNENMSEFISALMAEQLKAVYILAIDENPQIELEKIAEEAGTMAQMLLDDINGLSMQILGDILVDYNGDKPAILEEYAQMIIEAAVKER